MDLGALLHLDGDQVTNVITAVVTGFFALAGGLLRRLWNKVNAMQRRCEREAAAARDRETAIYETVVRESAIREGRMIDALGLVTEAIDKFRGAFGSGVFPSVQSKPDRREHGHGHGHI